MQPVQAAIDKAYQSFHRMLFGFGAEHSPPLWLWALITAVTLARIIPATYSQWEDPLWALVTQINGPWKTTLGFGTTDTVHILYGVIVKILMTATGHRHIDFVSRLPSLLAGFAFMPLCFAVFSRIGGITCGTLVGLCTVLLPTCTEYSVDARGYMLLDFLMVWALGLTPGMCDRLRPLRLALAYFLVGLSHGLALLAVACFALLGCFTGPAQHRRPVFFVNMLLALPAFTVNIPMVCNMLLYKKTFAQPEHEGLLRLFSFMPRWLGYQFGSPVIPLFSLVFCAAMLAGVAAVFRKSRTTGLALLAFMTFVPLMFGVNRISYTLDRYSMLCLPFWLWAAACGIASVPWPGAEGKNISRYAVAVCGALLLVLTPRTWDYLRYPEQNYREAYTTIVRDYPDQKTVFGFTPAYSVGLGYYARQFGLDFRIINCRDDLSDTVWRHSRTRCIIVASESDVRPDLMLWLRRNAVLVKEFRGMALPTLLYVSSAGF